MNTQILPRAVDGNVSLCAEDAAALAEAQAALERITAASPETRQKIETLQNEELVAKGQAAVADVSGSRGTSRKAHFFRIRITAKLERARRAAVKEFARPRAGDATRPVERIGTPQRIAVNDLVRRLRGPVPARRE